MEKVIISAHFLRSATELLWTFPTSLFLDILLFFFLVYFFPSGFFFRNELQFDCLAPGIASSRQLSLLKQTGLELEQRELRPTNEIAKAGAETM